MSVKMSFQKYICTDVEMTWHRDAAGIASTLHNIPGHPPHQMEEFNFVLATTQGRPKTALCNGRQA
jgi:hypothetical protein